MNWKITVSKFKKSCIGCDKTTRKTTKEHFWPKWLIKLTNMTGHKIPWIGGKKVYPMTATIPLCKSCNQTLGSELEAPMQQIILDLENGDGISDNEAEIFIRWCWKMEGFSWRLRNPDSEYNKLYTIIERALQSIDEIRPSLVLAIAIVEEKYRNGKDFKPMGLCNINERNAIVVSGVISNIAFIVLIDTQVGNLPVNYSYYPLSALRDGLSDAKLFHPKRGFKTFEDAKKLTREAANYISRELDKEISESLTSLSKETK